MRRTWILVLLTLVGGGAAGGMYTNYHKEPFPAEPGIPHGKTAVLSVLSAGTNPETHIVEFDGKKLGCWKAGCPLWIRVGAGTHTFKLSHVKAYHIVPSISVEHTFVDVVVEKMEPKHVYVISLAPRGDELDARTTDLGESPDYGINLGRGKSLTFYRVTF